MVSRSPRIVLWRKMQVGGRRSKAWGVGEENWPKGFRGIWVEESVVMSSTYLNLLLRKYPFYIPVGASSQDQSFLTLTLLTFGAGGFFVIRGFPVPCRTFNSIPSCDSLLMPQNISRLYQLSTEGKIPPSSPIENPGSRWSAFTGQRMDVWPRLTPSIFTLAEWRCKGIHHWVEHESCVLRRRRLTACTWILIGALVSGFLGPFCFSQFSSDFYPSGNSLSA